MHSNLFRLQNKCSQALQYPEIWRDMSALLLLCRPAAMSLCIAGTQNGNRSSCPLGAEVAVETRTAKTQEIPVFRSECSLSRQPSARRRQTCVSGNKVNQNHEHLVKPGKPTQHGQAAFEAYRTTDIAVNTEKATAHAMKKAKLGPDV